MLKSSKPLSLALSSPSSFFKPFRSLGLARRTVHSTSQQTTSSRTTTPSASSFSSSPSPSPTPNAHHSHFQFFFARSRHVHSTPNTPNSIPSQPLRNASLQSRTYNSSEGRGSSARGSTTSALLLGGLATAGTFTLTTALFCDSPSHPALSPTIEELKKVQDETTGTTIAGEAGEAGEVKGEVVVKEKATGVWMQEVSLGMVLG
ncbi:hypothetical protein HK102_010762, partial [Quaeritorhiza haematococci]